MPQPTGQVFIVGAGPGSPEHLTLQGFRLLSQAEVVVCDALVDVALLQLIPPTCEVVDVGKRGGQPSLKQSEIDRLLVELCHQGKQVVRLKSGDPFIFGRTASEISALKDAGCRFEVLPGVSSALAAPLLNYIPLTDPNLCRCFAVLTGHEPDKLDWASLARIDTLVILMGTQNLPQIVERLIQQGRSPQTPVAILKWAGHPQQQSWIATLETIFEKTLHQSLSPSVIIIGEVVSLQPNLLPIADRPQSDRTLASHLTCPQSIMADSQDNSADTPTLSLSENPQTSENPANSTLPLFSKTILVTRATGQSNQFSQLLRQRGATVIEMPTIEIGPPSSWELLDNAIAHLPQFDWLILTSTNGVDYFFERLQTQSKDARALANLKVAVVGKKTAECLRKQGIEPDFIPPNFVADSLVEAFPISPSGLKILFPRVETGGREVLVQEFTSKGAIVTEVPAYQSGCAQTISAEVVTALQTQQLDAITFASSKTVQCFHQLLQSPIQTPEPSKAVSINSSTLPIPPNCCIASIGPQTSVTCKTLLGRVDVEATQYTLEGLTEAIVGWFSVPDKSL